MSLSHAHTDLPNFKLYTNLNHPRYAQRVSNFLEDGHLKNGIAQLNLESGNKHITLLSFLQRGWKGGITIISAQASTSQQLSGQYGAVEAGIIMDIANMVILVVGEYRSKHPEEINNEQDRLRHINTATIIVVETFYEAFKGPQGAFSTTLLGTQLHNLVARTTLADLSRATQRELDQLKIKFEALSKENDKKFDDLVADLVAAKRVNVELRQEALVAKASISRLESQSSVLSEQIVQAEDKAKASQARAIRAAKKADEEELKAQRNHDSIAHYSARTKAAEDLTDRASLRTAELQGLYFTALENQWAAVGRMPQDLWERIQPYNTLLTEDYNFDPFFARSDSSAESAEP